METTRNLHSKADIIACLRHERALWVALLATVGEERMGEPGAMGARNFRDLIAHLTASWRREWGCLEAIRRGEAPMPHPAREHLDLINDWIYHTNRDRPLVDQVRDADNVWLRFEATLEAIPERDLLEPQRFHAYEGRPLGPRIVADFVDHYHLDHEADVIAWLARTGQVAASAAMQ
jgi:hypothetical protein